MYPYGRAVGDIEIGHSGVSETAVTLTSPLKYYGQSFNTAYVSATSRGSSNVRGFTECFRHFKALLLKSMEANPLKLSDDNLTAQCRL